MRPLFSGTPNGQYRAPLPNFGQQNTLIPNFGRPNGPFPNTGILNNPAPNFGNPGNPVPSFGNPNNPRPSFMTLNSTLPNFGHSNGPMRNICIPNNVVTHNSQQLMGASQQNFQHSLNQVARGMNPFTSQHIQQIPGVQQNPTQLQQLPSSGLRPSLGGQPLAENPRQNLNQFGVRTNGQMNQNNAARDCNNGLSSVRVQQNPTQLQQLPNSALRPSLGGKPLAENPRQNLNQFEVRSNEQMNQNSAGAARDYNNGHSSVRANNAARPMTNGIRTKLPDSRRIPRNGQFCGPPRNLVNCSQKPWDKRDNRKKGKQNNPSWNPKERRQFDRNNRNFHAGQSANHGNGYAGDKRKRPYNKGWPRTSNPNRRWNESKKNMSGGNSIKGSGAVGTARKLTLLRKLLHSDVERDDNRLLQVFRFMAMSSFFEPGKPLEFPTVKVKGYGFEYDVDLGNQESQAEASMADDTAEQADANIATAIGNALGMINEVEGRVEEDDKVNGGNALQLLVDEEEKPAK